MKQAKHTPGNWSVDYDGDGCHVTFDEGPVVYDTTEEDAASLRDVAELKANARLIAAAPDLLEALDRICKYLTVRTMEDPNTSLQELANLKVVVGLGREAIAKAQGGAE